MVSNGVSPANDNDSKRWTCCLMVVITAASFGRLAPVVGADEVAACQPPQVKWPDLKAATNMFNQAPDGSKNTFLVLNQACVDQEEVILYDPDVVASHPGEEGLPGMDLGNIEYYYRHASAQAVAEAVGRANHRPAAELNMTDVKPVLGSPMPKMKLGVRLPAANELKDLPSFSSCTLPIVIFTLWPMNMAEFWSRVPAMLSQFQQNQLFDDNVTLVLATPAKLPLEGFNINLMQPFSRYKPISFSDFSSRLPADAPSNSTAEGRHVRCFEKLIVWRSLDGSYPAMAIAADHIKQYYKDLLPTVDVWAAGGLGPEVMRVLIEQRPSAHARQFLELDKLLQECNQDKTISVPGSRYTSVQCHARTLGGNFLEDTAIIRHANVFVSFHGAGQTNAMLMDTASTMIEVRPHEFGTKYKFFGNNWQPLISDQTQQSFFWFGLNIENKELNQDSHLQTSGVQSDNVLNARDRNVILRWQHLKPLLNIVADINGDRAKYKERWPHNVTYTVGDDMQLSEHGHLFNEWKEKSAAPARRRKRRLI